LLTCGNRIWRVLVTVVVTKTPPNKPNAVRQAGTEGDARRVGAERDRAAGQPELGRDHGQDAASDQKALTIVAPVFVSATRSFPFGEIASSPVPVTPLGRATDSPVRNLVMFSFTIECASRQ